MKFKVDTQEFKRAITKASNVLVKKSSVPVLENIKIDVNTIEEVCVISSSNLDQFVSIKIGLLEGNESGGFVFSQTKELVKAVKFFKDGTILFEVKDGKVTISCGGKKVEQLVFNVGEFPETPSIDAESAEEYDYNAKELKDRLNLVKYACSKTDTRPVLTGVHFNKEDMVACDGFRIALNKDSALNIKAAFTIPFDAIKIVSSVLEGSIKIKVTNKLIELSDENATVTSRLLAEDYVNYNQFFAVDGQDLSVGTKSFLDALKYLKAFEDKTSDIPVVWNSDSLKYRSSGGNYESAVAVNGEFDFDIGFNMVYLEDVMKQFSEDSVNVVLKDQISPAILRDNSDRNMALVLPMRI